MTAISKAFQLTINPEPTFNGILWLTQPVSGAATWAATAGKFNLSAVINAGNSAVVFRAYGGDGTAGGQITIPASAKTRHCNFHLDVSITTSGGFNIVPGDNEIDVAITQVTPPTNLGFSFPWATVVSPGSYDHAFILPAGSAFTLNIVVLFHAYINPGGTINLTWDGSLYVPSYS